VYTWNYDVLLTALESYVAAGFGKNIIVIDNSSDRRIVGDERVIAMVGEVIPTRARLTFSQSQNLLAGVLSCRIPSNYPMEWKACCDFQHAMTDLTSVCLRV
jgi:hypothetical protein